MNDVTLYLGDSAWAAYYRGAILSWLGEQHHSDEAAAISALMAMERAGVELASRFNREALDRVPEHDWFEIQHSLSTWVARTQCGLEAVTETVLGMLNRCGRDFSQGSIVQGWKSYLRANPRRLETFLERGDDDLAMSQLFSPTLRVLAETDPERACDIALATLKITNGPMIRGAIFALGDMPVVASRSAQIVKALHQLLDGAPDAEWADLAIWSALRQIRGGTMRAHPAEEQLVQDYLKTDDSKVRHRLYDTLFLDSADYPDPIIDAVLQTLEHIKPEETGNAARAASLFRPGTTLFRYERLREALARFACAGHDLSGRPFQTLRHYISKKPFLRDRLLVEMLVDANISIARQASALIDSLDTTVRTLAPHPGILGTEQGRHVFLWRTLGYLSVARGASLSIIVAIMNAAKSDNERDRLAHDVTYLWLRNYPIDFDLLKTAHTDGVLKTAAWNRLSDIAAEFVTRFDGMTPCDAFAPDEEARLIQRANRMEEAREVRKAADANSVMMQLVSRQVLLYGEESVTTLKSEIGPARRMPMKLQEFSVEMAIPRMSVNAPFHDAYTRLRLKTHTPDAP